MPIHYRCRYCETEVGVLPYDADEMIDKLHHFEIGEIDDYIERDAQGKTTVQCICEQCEDSLRQFPDYHALKRWLQ